MSHNVTLKGISIDNMGNLRNALNEINRDFGTRFELKEGKIPSRNYMGSRLVSNDVVGVITDPTMQYDITLTRGADGKVSMQTEALMINSLIDKFGIDTRHAINVATGDACKIEQAGYGMRNESTGMQLALGTIIQRYSAIEAEETAARQGYMTRREYDQKTGVLNVVATVN